VQVAISPAAAAGQRSIILTDWRKALLGVQAATLAYGACMCPYTCPYMFPGHSGLFLYVFLLGVQAATLAYGAWLGFELV